MNRILALRKEKKWSQQELADAISSSRQAISKWELGHIDLSTETVHMLCDVFDVTADYLLGFSEIRNYDMSAEEFRLVAAYRAADEDARAMVALALKRFMPEKKETAAG